MNESYQNNQTRELIALDPSNSIEIKIFLFILFLMIYMTALFGDIYIIILVFLDAKLHNPMYFFLANFSFINICLMSVIDPLFLINLNSRRPKITFSGCLVQLYLFSFTASMEFFLLAVMGYDRYVAICNPFHYSYLMNWKFCGCLVGMSYGVAAIHPLLYILMISQLSNCSSNQIPSFFCDLPPLLKRSCPHTVTYKFAEYTEGFSILVLPFLVIIASYAPVLYTILNMRSVDGRRKAFSTCSSHLTLVALLYSSVVFMYFKPSVQDASGYDRIVVVVYSAIVPMLNPFIYSLRNKDIKIALKKFLGC